MPSWMQKLPQLERIRRAPDQARQVGSAAEPTGSAAAGNRPATARHPSGLSVWQGGPLLAMQALPSGVYRWIQLTRGRPCQWCE